MHTAHFRVHFRPGALVLAGHAAQEGERAWSLLAREIPPPHGKVDLILSDAADFSNGATSVFPSNRIVLLATPPLSEPGVQYYDDWVRLILVHELAHVFHLDRTRGIWSVVRALFGRVPGSFPNSYQPSWVVEGIPVYYETRFSAAGRIRGSYHTQIMLSNAAAGHWPAPAGAGYLSERWPDGVGPYVFGGRFMAGLDSVAGDSAVPRFIRSSAAQLIPVRVGHPLEQGTGFGLTPLWRGIREDYERQAVARPAEAAVRLDGGFRRPPTPVVASDGTVAWFSSPAGRAPEIVQRHPDGREERHLSTAGVDLSWSQDTLYASWLDFEDPRSFRSELHRLERGRWRRLTRAARVTDIAAGPSGVVAVQVGGTGNRLVRVRGDTLSELVPDTLGVSWASPAVAADGSIAVVRHDSSGYGLLIMPRGDPAAARLLRPVDGGVLTDPAWERDGGLLFSNDATGLPQIYRLEGEAACRLTDEPFGAMQPAPAPDGWLYFSTMQADGFAVMRSRLESNAGCMGEAGETAVTAVTAATVETAARAEAAVPVVTGYSPWPALRPHYFIPYVVDAGPSGTIVGGFTSGSDPVGRLAYSLDLGLSTSGQRLDGGLALVYSRWARHALDVSFSQRWGDGGSISSPSARVLSRERDASLGFTTTWRNWWRSVSLRAGVDYEQNYFETDRPVGVSFFAPEFGAASLTAGLGRVLATPLGISDEDGATLLVRYRRRWRLDLDGWSDEWRGRLAGYLAIKGLGLYAHPVLAARLAGAVSAGPDRETFGIGGASGTTVQPVLGVNLGTSRAFPVRGYEPGELRGDQVVIGSLEARIPLSLIAEPVGALPVGIDRLSVRLFGDFGTVGRVPAGAATGWLASAGVEMVWDIVVLYDVPVRLRGSVASALRDGRVTRSGKLKFGMGFGADF
ncbi:MAG: hypothetical protein AB7Q69_09655 [Gemmatimonadales bacterium]